MAPPSNFPTGLLDWAGHRSGGVRKPFVQLSGRPSKSVIETPLLARLRKWVVELHGGQPDVPHAVLLVGGPGNGKTEAVEEVLRTFDATYGLEGALVSAFENIFSGENGLSIPRAAQIPSLRSGMPEFFIVQDASVSDPKRPGTSPAVLLIDDFEWLATPTAGRIYIACVNRGILDDALLVASDQKHAAHAMLETVIRSVGLNPKAPLCWPLSGYPHVAVWPMDVESLVRTQASEVGFASPAEQLLSKAIDKNEWPESGTCPAGEACPFCRSRASLERESSKQALLTILRRYELATGKRWSFRDLFSLISHLLAGMSRQDTEKLMSPCDWAAHQVALSSRGSAHLDGPRLLAPFLLVGAQYEHALFGSWPRLNRNGIRKDLKELAMESDPGLLGFHYFLTSPREIQTAATLRPQLSMLCEVLDPALAEPCSSFRLTTRQVWFKDIDARFSQSVAEGLDFVRRLLSRAEIVLLELLSRSDEQLSSGDARRRKPEKAKKLQFLIRDFSCRLVRRSLGVRYALTYEHETLGDFEELIGGDMQLLHRAGKQVENLINDEGRFCVSLNTTFGEPLLPPPRRATMSTEKQKVRAMELPSDGRPLATVRFLAIGNQIDKAHSLALTYDLFRSVRELESGMVPASLPRAVVALLDTTKARLAGVAVRDADMLDGADIRIGTRDTVISPQFGGFVVSNPGIS